MVARYPVAGELVSLRDAMDRWLNESFGNTSRGGSLDGRSRMPLPLDVYSTGDEVVIIAAVPGIDPENINVTVDKGTVTISGSTPDVAQSSDANQATWFLHELPRGTFSRSITLPVDIDASKVDASFQHGVLRLELPMAETAKPRKIQIRSVSADELLDSRSSSQHEHTQGSTSQTEGGTTSGSSSHEQSGQAQGSSSHDRSGHSTSASQQKNSHGSDASERQSGEQSRSTSSSSSRS